MWWMLYVIIVHTEHIRENKNQGYILEATNSSRGFSPDELVPTSSSEVSMESVDKTSQIEFVSDKGTNSLHLHGPDGKEPSYLLSDMGTIPHMDSYWIYERIREHRMIRSILHKLSRVRYANESSLCPKFKDRSWADRWFTDRACDSELPCPPLEDRCMEIQHYLVNISMGAVKKCIDFYYDHTRRRPRRLSDIDSDVAYTTYYDTYDDCHAILQNDEDRRTQPNRHGKFSTRGIMYQIGTYRGGVSRFEILSDLVEIRTDLLLLNGRVWTEAVQEAVVDLVSILASIHKRLDFIEAKLYSL